MNFLKAGNYLWKLLGNLQEEFAGVVARVESLPLASLGDFVRGPHKGMISHMGTMLQSATGEELSGMKELLNTIEQLLYCRGRDQEYG